MPCFVEVAYNDYDVTLPVAKRVQHLVRKVRDVIGRESGGSETRDVIGRESDDSETGKPRVVRVIAERKRDTAAVAVSSSEMSGDFVRKLLRSDDFFASEKDDVQLVTDDSALWSRSSQAKKTTDKTRSVKS